MPSLHWSAPNGRRGAEHSIVAFDPVENAEVTYQFMVPFLHAFFHFLPQDAEVEAIGIHPYGGFDELRGMVELTYATFGRRVWVTEFNLSGANSEEKQLEFLVRAVDFLERSPHVEGYAWFKERIPGVRADIALLQEESGELTPLGEAYVNLPPHDPAVYYRLPGRLQAQRCIRQHRAGIWPSSDIDGLAHMASEASGGWIEFHVYVDQPGPYVVNLRVAGSAGNIRIRSGEGEAASVRISAANSAWSTVSTTLDLESGPQTLRVQFLAPDQKINWIEFAHQ